MEKKSNYLNAQFLFYPSVCHRKPPSLQPPDFWWTIVDDTLAADSWAVYKILPLYKDSALVFSSQLLPHLPQRVTHPKFSHNNQSSSPLSLAKAKARPPVFDGVTDLGRGSYGKQIHEASWVFPVLRVGGHFQYQTCQEQTGRDISQSMATRLQRQLKPFWDIKSLLKTQWHSNSKFGEAGLHWKAIKARVVARL